MKISDISSILKDFSNSDDPAIIQLSDFLDSLPTSSNESDREFTSIELFNLVNILLNSNLNESQSQNHPIAKLKDQLRAVVESAEILKKSEIPGMLTQENFDLIISMNKDDDKKETAYVLIYLYKANLLNQQDQSNRKRLKENTKDIFPLRCCLSRLLELEMLTQENFEALTTSSEKLFQIWISYPSLVKQGPNLFNKENMTILLFADEPEDAKDALLLLDGQNLLTPENKEIIAQRQSVGFFNNKVSCAKLLITLESSNLLTSENRDKIKNQAYCPLQILNTLQNGQPSILTQENFNAVMHYSDIFDDTYEINFSWIPNFLITQNLFDQICEICEAFANNPAAARTAINHYITWVNQNQILPDHIHIPQAQDNQHPQIDSQVTHTTSVHRTVSESAMRLWERYGNQLNQKGLDSVIGEVQEWAKTLNAVDPKQAAAQRGIAGFSQSNYIDPLSKLKLKEVIALVWLAIHDNSQRFGTLDDAINLFIDGFYEAQRGYNLNAKNQDQGGEDSFICEPGALNKIFEKLVGVHPDVEVLIISKGTAGLKLQRLILNAAQEYLLSCQPEQSETFLAKIKEEKDLTSIWDNIKEGVTKELDEAGFKVIPSVFKDEADWNDFIDFCAKDTEVDDEWIEQFSNKCLVETDMQEIFEIFVMDMKEKLDDETKHWSQQGSFLFFWKKTPDHISQLKNLFKNFNTTTNYDYKNVTIEILKILVHAYENDSSDRNEYVREFYKDKMVIALQLLGYKTIDAFKEEHMQLPDGYYDAKNFVE